MYMAHTAHVNQHVINVRPLERGGRSIYKQAFQRATVAKTYDRFKSRHLFSSAICASSLSVAGQSGSSQRAAFTDQDIFLIAGAGIAGLAMAAALTKVCMHSRCCFGCLYSCTKTTMMLCRLQFAENSSNFQQTAVAHTLLTL